MNNCKLAYATFVALSLLAAENVVNAACEEASDCIDYPLFAQMMATRASDYTWRSHDVVTDDGYELTMFEITADANGEKIQGQGLKGQLLLQHGYSSDSQTWFGVPDPSRPAFPQQLFDEGFSVWFGNTRGATYSKGHDDLEPYTEDSNGVVTGYGPDYEAYWNFDLDDMSGNDVPAMLEEMHGYNDNCQKITILAHSQGTNVVMRSLSLADRAQKYVSQAIVLEPCFLADTSGLIPGGLNNTKLIALEQVLNAANVYSFFGPVWDQQVEAICELSDLICAIVSSLDITGQREVGVKQTRHLVQCDLMNEWQAFSDNWLFSWTRDTADVEPEDVNANIAVRALYANQDTLCPRARLEDAGLLTFPSYDAAEDQFIDGGHSTATSLNTEEFFDKVMALIEPNAGERMSYRVCRRTFDFGI